MIDITVAYATTSRQVEIPLRVENNCTIAMAIHRSGILQQFSEIHLSQAGVGIYGKLVALDDLVQAGDRIEIYRPLTVEPKKARLRRAATAMVTQAD